MYTSTLMASLAFLFTAAVSAAAIASPNNHALHARNLPANYVIQSVHSTAPIHLQFISASNNKFFIGNATASYCPDTVTQQGGTCPVGTSTVFAGECALDVEVPGGQLTYMLPTGELKFVQAHSADIPLDAQRCPLALTARDSSSCAEGSACPAAEVVATGFGSTGLMACPTESASVWQVFGAMQNASVPLGDVSACIGFEGLAYDAGSDFGAWQYT